MIANETFSQNSGGRCRPEGPRAHAAGALSDREHPASVVSLGGDAPGPRRAPLRLEAATWADADGPAEEGRGKECRNPLDDNERTRCEVWTRVMGYHRPVSAFNAGKRSEHAERRYFVERRCDGGTRAARTSDRP